MAKNSKKDPKIFFSFYKFKERNNCIGPVKVDNKIITKDEELVDVFNDFFSSVFTNEDLSNISILDMQKQKILKS